MQRLKKKKAKKKCVKKKNIEKKGIFISKEGLYSRKRTFTVVEVWDNELRKWKKSE